MSEGDNGKDKGKVAAIADRRTSSGAKPKGEWEGEEPVYGAPMPIREADPFDLIHAGRGKTQDLIARRALNNLRSATNQALGYLVDTTAELAARDDAMLVYLRHSWLWRMVHRPPVFPPFPPGQAAAEGKG